MANIWLVFYHAAHWQNHLEKWMQSLKIWLEERESITVHDRLALWFKQEIDWPIDFAQNVNVQCCRQREALSYQDGWAGSTYFPWSYFLQDKYSSGETKRTVGIEQFQKAEFVSFELTEHIGRVLKCLFFFLFVPENTIYAKCSVYPYSILYVFFKHTHLFITIQLIFG